jgi:hypothetical protein
LLTRPGTESKLGTTEKERRDQSHDTTVGLQFRPETTVTTTGWRPSCRCEHDGGGWAPVPATVLDPFGGSGTTGAVAQSLGRRAVLIELNPEYIAQALARIGAARGRGDGPAVDVPVPFAGDGLWSDEVSA